MLGEAMISERGTSDEVLATIRSGGLAGVHQADAVILEADGNVSVIPASGDS